MAQSIDSGRNRSRHPFTRRYRTTVLITCDRDFGDLIFSRGMPTPRAILYVRLPHRQADATADRLLSLIERGGIEGHIITITKDGERTKPFPAGA
jgi:hypothetical protein